ncbi:MAG: hypothetical protein ACKN82_21460 [Pirellula sp.]
MIKRKPGISIHVSPGSDSENRLPLYHPFRVARWRFVAYFLAFFLVAVFLTVVFTAVFLAVVFFAVVFFAVDVFTAAFFEAAFLGDAFVVAVFVEAFLADFPLPKILAQPSAYFSLVPTRVMVT